MNYGCFNGMEIWKKTDFFRRFYLFCGTVELAILVVCKINHLIITLFANLKNFVIFVFKFFYLVSFN